MTRSKLALAACCLLPACAMAQPAEPAWAEAFDRLDPSLWQVQLYSFPANGCDMVAGAVDAQASRLSLSVELNAARAVDAQKICSAGEVGSYRFFTYGLFTVRMKAPALPGGVSAFFLMNRWQPVDWEHQEIDIELLGSQPTAAQLTTHHFQNGGRDWKSAATTVDLGFNFSLQWHDYAVLWTPEAVRWYVDGRALHVETRLVPHVPLQVRMNIYLGNPAEPGVAQWLGGIDPARLPARAQFAGLAYYPLGALPRSGPWAMPDASVRAPVSRAPWPAAAPSSPARPAAPAWPDGAGSRLPAP